MNILAIETSCDETSAAIVKDGRIILVNVVATSIQMHQKYGGIVPEVAARKQLEFMIPVLNETIQQFNNSTINNIDAIAVTVGPGLIGSLLVGVETAKTLAYAWNKPLIPVNHVLAHPYAAFITKSDKRKAISNNNLTIQQFSNSTIQFPIISLVVSGGHTELYFMQDEKSMKWIDGTLDDAAGECFDKCARLLGLKYPGGPEIAAAAAKYQIPNTKYKPFLPRPMIHDDSLNFSFSGLKTAVLREVKKIAECHSRESGNLIDPRVKPEDDILINSLAHEVQESITDVLVKKTLQAAEKYSVKSIIVSGGVAANQRLKQKINSELLILNSKLSVHVPPPHLCVDTAAYIASYAYFHNNPVDWRKIEAQPDLDVEVGG